MSYGVNDMRDGVNLSRIQVTRPLVMHTEVTNLPNLSGYLRFGRDLPVVRFADKYNDVPSIVEAFAERSRPPRHIDRKSTRLNSSHSCAYRMPSSACKQKKLTQKHKQTQ